MTTYILYTRTEAGTLEPKNTRCFTTPYLGSRCTGGIDHGMAGIKGILGREDGGQRWSGALGGVSCTDEPTANPKK